jgi:hypothetical protein
MKTQGKFTLFELDEFNNWLSQKKVKRSIKIIQQHHTYKPDYSTFKGDNHFELCTSMEKSHLKRGFAEIAQNFTTFPDGKIMVCRDMDKIPAGVKGANEKGICIEHVGHFDLGGDAMNEAHKITIIEMTRLLLLKFNLIANDETVVYHHWYDLNTGKRITQEGKGSTKTCPGTNFFGGNTLVDFNAKFLPHLI